jgi:hypothetical protein
MDMLRRDHLPALALLVLIHGVASAQSLDESAGKPIQAPHVYGYATRFFEVKNDPSSMLVATSPLKSILHDNVLDNSYDEDIARRKADSDALKRFGVPAVEVKSIGRFQGAPAMIVGRSDEAAFDPGHPGTDSSAWIHNVHASSLASLERIERGLNHMEAKGDSVRLTHFMIDKDGTFRVLDPKVTLRPETNDGIPLPPNPDEKRQNKQILDTMRDGVRLVLAAEKAGIKPDELVRADRILADTQRAEYPWHDPHDSLLGKDYYDTNEARRLVANIEAGMGDTHLTYHDTVHALVAIVEDMHDYPGEHMRYDADAEGWVDGDPVPTTTQADEPPTEVGVGILSAFNTIDDASSPQHP